ncbi:MAG: transferase [Verrucomicrobia bacterium]|nr:transferase [Verrucomicrobiota bacterium]
MEIIGSMQGLMDLVRLQVANLYRLPDDEKTLLPSAIEYALSRCETCFTSIHNKYYRNANGIVVFNPLHSAQYCIFLYYLANTLGCEMQAPALATKLYCLNKALNAVDIYYEVQLPERFIVEHPVGSVLGRARYSNYLVLQQGCTVGGNQGAYPVLGEYVWLHAQAMVVGNCRIGNNVFVAAGTYIKDCDVPDNTIVFGRSPDLVFKAREPEYFLARSVFRNHRRDID